MERNNLLIQAMFSIKDNSISDDCWSAFKCFIPWIPSLSDLSSEFCQDKYKCIEIIEHNCPDMLYIPASSSFIWSYLFCL